MRELPDYFRHWGKTDKDGADITFSFIAAWMWRGNALVKEQCVGER